MFTINCNRKHRSSPSIPSHSSRLKQHFFIWINTNTPNLLICIWIRADLVQLRFVKSENQMLFFLYIFPSSTHLVSVVANLVQGMEESNLSQTLSPFSFIYQAVCSGSDPVWKIGCVSRHDKLRESASFDPGRFWRNREACMFVFNGIFN